MDLEQYFEEAVAHNHSSEEGKDSLWNNSPDAVRSSDDNPSGGFDCNICLDAVQDPVVTLCGHLYCWPCIYKWLHFDAKQHQCPVCKAEVSDTKLVPLYGRGLNTKASRGKTPQFSSVIPKRPLGPTCGTSTTRLPNATNTTQFAQHLHHRGYPYQPHMYYPQQGNYAAASDMTINVLDPVTRMFGEMVYTRVFGNSVTDLYAYPNSYNLAWSTSPRIRRHVMQADKSLSRISFFLLCCILVCLLLF